MNETLIIATVQDLDTLAAKVLDHIEALGSSNVTIALHGDLGAGKTAFVKSFAKVLGVSEEVTSPTFTVLRGYDTTHARFTRLLHMDAYRLESDAELGPLRFGELLTTEGTILCIEWPAKIKGSLPPECVHIRFEIIESDARKVVVSDKWSD